MCLVIKGDPLSYAERTRTAIKHFDRGIAVPAIILQCAIILQGNYLAAWPCLHPLHPYSSLERIAKLHPRVALPSSLPSFSVI
jgi:hypothetical protein